MVWTEQGMLVARVPGPPPPRGGGMPMHLVICADLPKLAAAWRLWTPAQFLAGYSNAETFDEKGAFFLTVAAKCRLL